LNLGRGSCACSDRARLLTPPPSIHITPTFLFRHVSLTLRSPLAFFVLFLVNGWMMFQVGAARKKYGIPYPTLYAVPGTPRDYAPPKEGVTTAAAPLTEGKEPLITAEEAYKFNCVQRGHQNSLENIPIIGLLTLVSWGFPIPAGFALLSWSLGRVFYMRGYMVRAEQRTNLLGALLTYPALLTLWGLSMATAIQLFRQQPP
jgi:glutathione S-transferase